jgi:hypothetical protein
MKNVLFVFLLCAIFNHANARPLQPYGPRETHRLLGDGSRYLEGGTCKKCICSKEKLTCLCKGCGPDYTFQETTLDLTRELDGTKLTLTCDNEWIIEKDGQTYTKNLRPNSKYQRLPQELWRELSPALRQLPSSIYNCAGELGFTDECGNHDTKKCS